MEGDVPGNAVRTGKEAGSWAWEDLSALLDCSVGCAQMHWEVGGARSPWDHPSTPPSPLSFPTHPHLETCRGSPIVVVELVKQ